MLGTLIVTVDMQELVVWSQKTSGSIVFISLSLNEAFGILYTILNLLR